MLRSVTEMTMCVRSDKLSNLLLNAVGGGRTWWHHPRGRHTLVRPAMLCCRGAMPSLRMHPCNRSNILYEYDTVVWYTCRHKDNNYVWFKYYNVIYLSLISFVCDLMWQCSAGHCFILCYPTRSSHQLGISIHPWALSAELYDMPLVGTNKFWQSISLTQ